MRFLLEKKNLHVAKTGLPTLVNSWGPAFDFFER